MWKSEEIELLLPESLERKKNPRPQLVKLI
jgi:hypothetical protein